MSAGLSLSAARADNFYHPPEWDPRKQSLDKYHGSHPLRERARKLDQGILVIRFEMPFNVWCDGCGELIGKGVRFNAEKQQSGQYHSTKIWKFTMHHHCGRKIVVRTDPKSCEYIIEEGAQRKQETFQGKDQQVIELPDDKERARLANDPLYKMEREVQQSIRVTEAKAQVAELLSFQKARGANGADQKWNRELKHNMRVRRREEQALDRRRSSLGLPSHIKLLPESTSDIAQARKSMSTATKALPSRSSIMSQDIFAPRNEQKVPHKTSKLKVMGGKYLCKR